MGGGGLGSGQDRPFRPPSAPDKIDLRFPWAIERPRSDFSSDKWYCGLYRLCLCVYVSWSRSFASSSSRSRDARTPQCATRDEDEANDRDRDRVVDARDARGEKSRRREREGDVPRAVDGNVRDARDEDAGDVRRRRRRRRRERYRWTHRGGDVGVLREEGARRTTTGRARLIDELFWIIINPPARRRRRERSRGMNAED